MPPEPLGKTVRAKTLITLLAGITASTLTLAAAPGPISIQRQGNSVVVSWPGTAKLQFATSLPANWQDVQNAPNQGNFTITASESQRYYRLMELAPSGPRYFTLDSSDDSGFPSVVIADVDNDGTVEFAYVKRGASSGFIAGKYSDNPPAQSNREVIPLDGFQGAISPGFLIAGDQNGDGLTDFVLFEDENSPQDGFRLIQRDKNSAIGSGTASSYASELGDDLFAALDASGGKALNEAGTKTSLAAWYTGQNESVWSRDSSPIGSGVWCVMAFDNAGSACELAVGALGDYNGDGKTDFVRAYTGCNNEIGVRAQPNGLVECLEGLHQPSGLDRVAIGLGKWMPRTVRISNGDLGTRRRQNLLVGATAGELRIFEYTSDTYGNANLFTDPTDAAEVVATIPDAQEGVNNFSVVELADLDGDGVVEIIAGTYDGKLNAYYRNSRNLQVGPGSWTPVNLLAGFPEATSAPLTTIAIGDVDRDGKLEIIAGQDVGNGVTSKVVVIDGIEGMRFSSTHVLRMFSLGSGANAFTDAVIADLNHDGQLDFAYVEGGSANNLVVGNYSDDPPALGTREAVAVSALGGAASPGIIVAGDQNGDGMNDVVLFESTSSSAKGFRLVQRDSSALGGGTSANYASEVGDNNLQAIDASGGRAFNEAGTKTSLAVYYAGANESIWSRDTAPIGSGAWCRMEFDNAGSGCQLAVGAIGDFNGDGFNDFVRAYLGCNNELGVRGQPNGVAACAPGLHQPGGLDRVISGLGKWMERSVRISSKDLGTPNRQNLLVAATAGELRVYGYGRELYGSKDSFSDTQNQNEIVMTIPNATAANAFSVVTVADVDLDGVEEILAGTADGKAYIFHRADRGATLGAGTWVRTDLLGSFSLGTAAITALKVGDLDKDGTSEILAAQGGGGNNNVAVIDGLENRIFSIGVRAAPPAINPGEVIPVNGLRFATVETATGSGFPDVVIADIDQDNKQELAYLKSGTQGSLVIGKYTDNPPQVSQKESKAFADLSGAMEPNLLVAGDQNGDGKADLVLFERIGSPANGFRLVQRDNSAFGSAGAVYASELGDDTLQTLDASGGKALTEPGTKTSLVAYYVGSNESVWSRDMEPIGAGTWCRMEFDNAGTGCQQAVGAMGDFNGDGFTDLVRAYTGCNNEIGIRSANDQLTECIDAVVTLPFLDRCAAGLGPYRERTVRISNGRNGTPSGQNGMIAAVTGNLWYFELDPGHLPYGTPFNAHLSGELFELIGKIPNPQVNVNNFTCARFADLDGDNINEIIAGTYDGKLYAFYRESKSLNLGLSIWIQANLLTGYSGTSDSPITGIAIGDLDGDGKVEVAVSNNFPEATGNANARENVIVIDGLEGAKFSSR